MKAKNERNYPEYINCIWCYILKKYDEYGFDKDGTYFNDDGYTKYGYDSQGEFSEKIRMEKIVKNIKYNIKKS